MQGKLWPSYLLTKYQLYKHRKKKSFSRLDLLTLHTTTLGQMCTPDVWGTCLGYFLLLSLPLSSQLPSLANRTAHTGGSIYNVLAPLLQSEGKKAGGLFRGDTGEINSLKANCAIKEIFEKYV